MDSRIMIVEEGPRGCGYRKRGGLYLRCDGPAAACGRMPVPVTTCPCCGAGIRPARGWTWIDPRPLVADRHCDQAPARCASCPMGGNIARAGLLWIGEKYYPTPAAWIEETARMGASRRITQVPRDFVVGITWVLVAHRKVDLAHGQQGPAIFSAFQPSRIECVVSPDASAGEIDALEKRGIVPVHVVPRPADPPQHLPPLDLGLAPTAQA